MLLHEIIKANETGKSSILIELLHPYKKSLYTYFKREYCAEPVLIVTDVFNAAQYGFIASSNEFTEAIDTYLEDDDSLTEDEKQEAKEVIGYQSMMLKNF